MNKFNNLLTAIGTTGIVGALSIVYNNEQNRKSDDANKLADRELLSRKLRLKENELELKKYNANLPNTLENPNITSQPINDIHLNHPHNPNSPFEHTLLEFIPQGEAQLIGLTFASFSLVILLGMIALYINEKKDIILTKYLPNQSNFIKKAIKTYLVYMRIQTKIAITWILFSASTMLLLSIYLLLR